MSLRTIIIWFTLLVFLTIAAGGFLGFSAITKSSEVRVQAEVDAQVRTAAAHVDSYLADFNRTVQMLAGMAEVRKTAASGTAADTPAINETMDRFAKLLQVSVCYLMDANGRVVASSNYRKPDSFMGKRYHFRPYFTDAMAGKQGLYLAKGVTSGKRGIYYSAPVLAPNRPSPIGVAVIKSDLVGLEAELLSIFSMADRNDRARALLISPEGIVFASSRGDSLFHSITPLSQEAIAAAREARQFGVGPWPALFSMAAENSRFVDVDGHPYHMKSMALSHLPGWQVAVMQSTAYLSKRSEETISDMLMFIILPVSTLVALFSLILFFIAEKVIRRQQRLQLKIEDQVRFFNTLMNAIPYPVFHKDHKGVYTGCNQAFADYWGWPADEVPGLTVFDMAPAKEAEIHHRADMALLNDPQVSSYETSSRRADGAIRQAILTKAIYTDSHGLAVGLVGIMVDITDRKQMEQALAESEEKFRKISSAAQDAIIMIDADGRIEFWNEAAAVIFGYTVEEAMGAPLHDMVAPKRYREAAAEGMASFRSHGEGRVLEHSVEMTALRKGGVEFPVELSVSGVKLKGQWHAVGIIRDITARKIAEEELERYSHELEQMVEARTLALNRARLEAEQSRDWMQAILFSAAAGLIVTDERGHVLMINDTAGGMLEIDIAADTGRHVDDVVIDDGLRRYMKASAGSAGAGRTYHFEVPDDKMPGQRYLTAWTSVVTDAQNNMQGAVTVLSDVTHEHQLVAMKDEFIKMAAHELRTPLTSVLGFSEILVNRDDLGRSEQQRFLGHIHTTARRLTHLVDDILTLAKIDSGQEMILQPTSEDLGAICEKLAADYRQRQPSHQFPVEIRELPETVMLDRKHFTQALENILDNAAAVSPEGSDIRIVAEGGPGGAAVVRVCDQGPGMSASQVAHIFDRFYRGDGSNTAPEGTGLGMTITKIIINAHGGDIRIDSREGVGTTVEITLPTRIETENPASAA